jgi:hypothetical protein
VAAALGAAYTTYAAAGEALANSYFAADADGKVHTFILLSRSNILWEEAF